MREWNNEVRIIEHAQLFKHHQTESTIQENRDNMSYLEGCDYWATGNSSYGDSVMPQSTGMWFRNIKAVFERLSGKACLYPSKQSRPLRLFPSVHGLRNEATVTGEVNPLTLPTKTHVSAGVLKHGHSLRHDQEQRHTQTRPDKQNVSNSPSLSLDACK